MGQWYDVSQEMKRKIILTKQAFCEKLAKHEKFTMRMESFQFIGKNLHRIAKVKDMLDNHIDIKQNVKFIFLMNVFNDT